MAERPRSCTGLPLSSLRAARCPSPPPQRSVRPKEKPLYLSRRRTSSDSEYSCDAMKGEHFFPHYQISPNLARAYRLSEYDEVREVRKDLDAFFGSKSNNKVLTDTPCKLDTSISSIESFYAQPYSVSKASALKRSAANVPSLQTFEKSSSQESESATYFKYTLPINYSQNNSEAEKNRFDPDHPIVIEVQKDSRGSDNKKLIKCSYINNRSFINGQHPGNSKLPDIVSSSEEACNYNARSHFDIHAANLYSNLMKRNSMKRVKFGNVCNKLQRSSRIFNKTRSKSSVSTGNYLNVNLRQSSSTALKKCSIASLSKQEFLKSTNYPLQLPTCHRENDDSYEVSLTPEADALGRASSKTDLEMVTHVGVGRWRLLSTLSLCVVWWSLGASLLSPLLLNAPVPYTCHPLLPLPNKELSLEMKPFVTHEKDNSCITFTNLRVPLRHNDLLEEAREKTDNKTDEFPKKYLPDSEHVSNTSSGFFSFLSIAPLNLELDDEKSTKYAQTANFVSYKDSLWLHGIDKIFYIELNNKLHNYSKAEKNWELTDIEPCSKVLYDKAVFTETLVSQFHLVCERSFLRRMIVAVQALGCAAGGALGAPAADRFGRVSIVRWSLLCFVLGCSCCLTVTSLGWWLVAWCCAAGSLYSAAIAIFVAVLESCQRHFKGIVTAEIGLSYSAGIIMLGLAGYCVRSWRYLYMITTFPAFLVLPLSFLLAESPDWLFRKSIRQARQLLRRPAFSSIGTVPKRLRQEQDVVQVFAAAGTSCKALLATLWLLQGTAQGALLPLAVLHMPDSPFLLIATFGLHWAMSSVVAMTLQSLMHRAALAATATAMAALLIIAAQYIQSCWTVVLMASSCTVAVILSYSSAWVLLGRTVELTGTRRRCTLLTLCLGTQAAGVLLARLMDTYSTWFWFPWMMPCLASGSSLLYGALSLLLPHASSSEDEYLLRDSLENCSSTESPKHADFCDSCCYAGDCDEVQQHCDCVTLAGADGHQRPYDLYTGAGDCTRGTPSRM